MKSEEPNTPNKTNPINFFIEVLKEGEKFPNEISYFNKQSDKSIEFSNIQLKIILDKISNLKDKRFLRIDKISERNLIYFLESNLTKQFANVFICSESKFDFSPYVDKINSNKSFLFAMGQNEFNLNFLNGNKELHVFLDNYAAFADCCDIVANLLGTGLIQSLEFIFKDKEADIYFAPLELLLLSEANKKCITQLILHNRLAEFKKENLENFVNNILLDHQSLRVLKIIGFELSVNEVYVGQEGEQEANAENNYNNNNDNENENNNLNINRKAELSFDFDIESILVANKKIKILSVAHDKRINVANELEFLEKFYICRIEELKREILACRYLAAVRNNFLPVSGFFHRINGFLRKYLVKFFPVQSVEVKNDFASKYLNYIEQTENELNRLPDYVIAKIEKIGFDRGNINTLEMDDFLEQVFGKEFN